MVDREGFELLIRRFFRVERKHQYWYKNAQPGFPRTFRQKQIPSSFLSVDLHSKINQ